MNHEELLNTLNSKQFMDSRTPETPYFALRAVVELHSPSPISLNKENIGCTGCGYDVIYSVWNQAYPCPTIQAIERELG